MNSLTNSKNFLFFAFLLTSIATNSQTNQWTWVGNDTVKQNSGNYGPIGVASTAFYPRGRGAAVSWIDTSGNAWLFGGIAQIELGPSNYDTWEINDLWKYNHLTKEWTWMKGDTVAFVPNIPGVKGVQDHANKPDGRRTSATWTGDDGNLWMYGGFGHNGTSRDMWRYNIATNSWTWMSGKKEKTGFIGNIDPAVFGIKGVPSQNNTPGGRVASSYWKDKAGNFWLYGGFGYTHTNMGYMNDLWKYNPSTNEWTWMKGDSVSNINGTHGIRTVSNINNNPGGRSSSNFWTDNEGNFWLHGGASDHIMLNDLWKFNPSTNEWTWMKGNEYSDFGMYKTKGVELEDILPQGRVVGYKWVDKKGNLWLFGGANNRDSGWLNDVWKYNLCTNNWTWVSGDSTVNSQAYYGTQGIASPSNMPRSRCAGVSWSDTQGNFWLMGGVAGAYIQSLRNGVWGDLWKYSPDSTSSCNVLPVQLVSFTGKRQEKAVMLTWIIENEVKFDHYQVERSYDTRLFEAIGSVTGRGSLLKQTYNLLDPLAFAKGDKVYYRLKMIDKDGKFTYSPIVVVDNLFDNRINIYPNPATTFFKIETGKAIRGRVDVVIIDYAGRIIMNKNYNADGRTIPVHLEKMVAGTYTIKILYKGEQYLKKLIIVK